MTNTLFERPWPRWGSFKMGEGPLAIAREMLQSLGEPLLVQLLEGGPQPDLALALPRKYHRWLLDGARRPAPPHKSRGPAPTPPGETYTALVKRAAQGKVAGSAVAEKFDAALAERVPAAAVACIPDGLWHLAAAAAWQMPACQELVANRLGDCLRARLLFRDGEVSAALSPESFWLLIAAATGTPPIVNGRFLFFRKKYAAFVRWRDPQTRHGYRAAQQLQSAALVQIGRPGWAGFYDQWLAGAIRSRWYEGFARCDRALGGALSRLPLLQSRPGHLAPEAANGQMSAASPILEAGTWAVGLPRAVTRLPSIFLWR